MNVGIWMGVWILLVDVCVLWVLKWYVLDMICVYMCGWGVLYSNIHITLPNSSSPQDFYEVDQLKEFVLWQIADFAPTHFIFNESV